MSPDLPVVVAAVALPFVAAGLTPLGHRLAGRPTGSSGERLRTGEGTGYAGAAVALACFGLVGSLLGTRGTVSLPWVPSLDVALRFRVDGLAVLFALLASGIGVLVFAYSARYVRDEAGLARYYAALLAFMGSILGVALAADLIALFLFWELTSLCSFVLVGHHTEAAESRYSARMAMVVTVGGGLCLLAGVLLLAVAAGDAGVGAFDLSAMLAEPDAVATALRDAGLFVPTLALFGVAVGAKSAQVPLHFWLPNAMVAPTPVSAFLHSATMVTVGVYFAGRIRPLFVGPEWTLLFATLGLATMLVGAVLAVVASDVKELLAYSTASHLGLMVAGFGFASTAGAAAGAFHLFNHALFKAALFLVAGVVAHEVGTRHIDDLGGLRRDLPVTAAVTGVAALSMAGIPPFNGFYSKELLFEASYEAAHAAGGLAWLYPAVAVVASVFTVLYSLRFLAVFLGERTAAVVSGVGSPAVALVAPPAVLAAVAAAVGAAPQLAVDAVVGEAVAATAVGAVEFHAGLPDHLSPAVAMSVLSVGGGLAAYPFLDRVRAGIEVGANVNALRANWWYDRWLSATEAASVRVDAVVHDGSLRSYVTWVVAAASALVLSGYAATVRTLPALDFGATAPMALVLVVALVAAVAVAVASSQVAGVLSLSILGFMVAIFYILASAPDLALTQLVVETLILLVFLLVLEQLPSFYADPDPRVLARDAGVSLAVGATGFVTVLLAGARAGAEPTATARYYATAALPSAGGTNVVNVILVDFRGFDTLGELLVISVAAVSVLVLVTMRNRGETR
ncbi:hydrogen gas-evolving membrane-bound hydrogenase subunit E [Halorussus halobius]|uniref:hydrogen gas-evolving membrane-bound hydrogenase subunit E n=1 Tax=Halorussus halobius TaxID=1710537 RepID=UPI001092B9CD|nr:hydrogen gas-evolving membrane-bound hydrogenase subunit E [Halorussus halobius]